MNPSDFARTLGEIFGAGASAKSVYGEPVTSGQRTVIPVASIRYGFGAGSGERAAGGHTGGGGGGGLTARPCGVVEVTPDGTRFIPFHDPRLLAAAALLGFAGGFLASSLRRR